MLPDLLRHFDLFVSEPVIRTGPIVSTPRPECPLLQSRGCGKEFAAGVPSWKLWPSDFTCQAPCRAWGIVFLWNASPPGWALPDTLKIYLMGALKYMRSAARPSLTR